MKFSCILFSRIATAMLLAGLYVSSGYSAETASDEPTPVVIAGPTADETQLFFQRDGEVQQVIRGNSDMPKPGRDSIPTTEAKARAIVQALVDGPTAAEQITGLKSFLPAGTTLGKLEFEKANSVRIFLDIPAEFVLSADYSPSFVETAGRAFMNSLADLDFRDFMFFVKDPRTGTYGQIRDFLNPPDPPLPPPPPLVDSSTSSVQSTKDTRNVPTQNGFVSGALSGKSVVLNASHGWFQNGTWGVQRGRTFGLLEDFSSAMFVNHYVIPLLKNAGATPRPVREPDSQTNTVVIDNADGAPTYVESGTWSTSGADGFINKATYTGTMDNPFGQASGTRYTNGSTAGVTATSTYTPSVPVTGYYNVYISYSQGTNRTANAHWQVHHSGDVTDFRINEQKTGGTWVLLGNFYFEQGASADQAKVMLLNDTGDSAIVSCDAVRFGGGMGSVARRGSKSGRPRWQEEAVNYLQYTGMLSGPFMGDATDEVTTYNDMQIGWSNRPQYANWEQTRDSLGNNLVYIGWHTNALNGTSCASGVETGSTGVGMGVYRAADGTANANTVNLTQKLFDSTMASIQQSYKSTFTRRQINSNNIYGESGQGNLGAVAGFFFEGLFHDNSSDSATYKDPKFRYAAARGIVHGLIQYYGGTVFPPEPVTNFQVKNIGNNQVRLDWTRGVYGASGSSALGSIASQFRVYKSSNGYGFDDGTDVGNALNATLTLTPGEVTFYRVSAVNTGGISVPSETLAVRVPLAGAPTLLIVNGYHRNDRFLAPYVSSSGIGGCTSTEDPPNTYRTFDPKEFQSYNYTIQHADAIAASGGYGIDSCSKDAINLNTTNLTTYPSVFWIAGQEAETDTTDGVDDSAFRPAEMTAISTYLSGGGNLFISGSEIAWDFGRSAATQAKQTFLSTYLKATFVNDSSNTYASIGSGGIFSGLGSVGYDNGSGNTYQVRFPDIIAPSGGAVSSMSYSGGSVGTAAIQYAGVFGAGTQPGKLVYMAYGFETLTSESARNNIMNRVITFFNPARVNNWNSF